MKKVLALLLLFCGSLCFSDDAQGSIVINGTSGQLIKTGTMDTFLGMSIEDGDFLNFKITYDETTDGLLGGGGDEEIYEDAIESITFFIGAQSATVDSFLGTSMIVNKGSFDQILLIADFDDISFESFLNTNTNQEFTSVELDPLGGIGFNEVNDMDFENSTTAILQEDSFGILQSQYRGNETDWDFSLSTVPEPASIAVWSLIGCCAAGGAYRRKRS